MTLAFAAAALAFSLTTRPPHSCSSHAHASPVVTRAPLAVAFLEPEDHIAIDKIKVADAVPENTWLRTPSGLRYKEIETVLDSPMPTAGDIVEIAYTVNLVSTGQTIDETLSLKFIVGQNDTLPLFEEMVTGMSVGSKRRVMLSALPMSASTEREKETLQFDIELRSIPTGKAALGFRAVRALPGVIRTVILLSFLPDILNFVGILPPGAPSMSQPGFGAVDIFSTPPDAAHALAQAGAAPVVDAANRWAADGLQGLF